MKKTIRTVIMCMCILAGAWLVSSPSYAQENHTYQTQIEPRCSGMANSTCNLFFPEYARGVKGDKGVKASGKLKQYGTLALAQDGYVYRNILNYYYSGSSYSDGDVVLFSYEE